jgi:4,5-DOPA dioxygenase extradiol
MSNRDRMPVLFIGHGTPMNAVDSNQWTEGWSELGKRLPRPDAILSISAHWLTNGGSLVTSSSSPRMNYDMYGFPPELYVQQYPAPGNVKLAEEIATLLRNVTPIYSDDQWGFDHGTWVVLRRLYPKADIPVIQLSMDYSRPPSFHYELARRLAPLRDQSVLILGSGNIVHNLARRSSVNGEPHDWAIEFDQKIATNVLQGDHQAVVDFQKLGSLAKLAHPSYDHFLPLVYVLGLQDPTEQASSMLEGFQSPSISMRSFLVS